MNVRKGLIVSFAALLIVGIGANSSNVNAKSHHHTRTHRVYHYHSHRNYLPRRFFGTWYAREPIGMSHSHKRGESVLIRVNRHGDYVKDPSFKGYVHPRYWTGGMYGEYHGQYGIINHGHTFVFNGGAKNNKEAGWYLHRI